MLDIPTLLKKPTMSSEIVVITESEEFVITFIVLLTSVTSVSTMCSPPSKIELIPSDISCTIPETKFPPPRVLYFDIC